MRILVTGSRTWLDIQAIERALLEYHPVDAHGFDLPDKPTLVHGDCPRGADRIAKIAATFLGWTLEPHPAAWLAPCRPECKPGHRRTAKAGGSYCPDAGKHRNQVMVDLGADVVLAFSRNSSPGTKDCVRRATAAGLKVIPHTDDGGV